LETTCVAKLRMEPKQRNGTKLDAMLEVDLSNL
jgi:hypothetical protein